MAGSKIKRKIILASTSPRRKKIFKKLGLKFEVWPSNYEENMSLPLPPRQLVQFLARGKAESVALKNPNALVVAGDTFIYFKGEVYGKPKDKEEAKKMLGKLSGGTHFVYTGFAVLDTKNKKIITGADKAEITFKKLSKKEIDDYVVTKEPLTRAGAYHLETIEATFVLKIKGNYESILGLPLDLVFRALKKFGIKMKNC